MDLTYQDELRKMCISSGFTKKGKVFFRLLGDGVLQVIRCRYERNLRGDVIHIGLLSMYSYLQPQWFTATGCITRYSITNCYYQNNKPLTFASPMPTQLDMLRSRVLPWLDSIDSQKKLIGSITKLDPRWNDRMKIGPYLACGEYNHGKKVIREILFQHDFASALRTRIDEESNSISCITIEREDDDLQRLLEMISRGDATEITSYLTENYLRNLGYAKFCTKHGVVHG